MIKLLLILKRIVFVIINNILNYQSWDNTGFINKGSEYKTWWRLTKLNRLKVAIVQWTEE